MSRGAIFFVAAMSLSAVSCSRTRLVDLRTTEAWAAAVILTGPMDAPSATAVQLKGGTATLDVEVGVEDGEREIALLYRLPLESLLLSHGRLPQSQGSLGRHLPAPDFAFSVDLAQPKLDREVVSTATASALFQAFLLPEPTTEACLAAGGCYPKSAAGECVTPCPTRAPVDPPVPAEWPRFRCDGWPKSAAAELGIEAPELRTFEACFAPAISACTAGDFWTPDSDCRPALAPCSEWPDGLPSDALYARAGAQAGDGSRLAPLSSLAEAVAVAVSSGRAREIALGPGQYPEDVQLGAGFRVRGCAASLRGTVRVGGGASALEEVRIEGDSRILVEPGASLDLSHVIVTPRGDASAVLSIAGTATVSRALLDLGSGVIDVRAQGHLVLRESQVSGGAGALLRVRAGGAVEARDVALSGGPALGSAMIEVEGGHARLARTRVESRDGPGTLLLFAGDAEGDLDQVALDGRTTNVLLGAVGHARIKGREVVTLDGGLGLGSDEMAEVSLTDHLAVGTDSAVATGGAVRFELSRGLAIGGVDYPLFFTGRSAVTLTDLTLANPRQALYASDQTVAVVERVHVLDARLSAVAASGIDGRYSDVIVRRTGVAGFTFLNPQGILNPHAGDGFIGRLDRLAVLGGSGVGLWISQKTTAHVRDVHVENIGVAGDRDCADAQALFFFPVCQGDGIRLASSSSGTLDEFEVLGSKRGLVVFAPEFRASSGLVGGNEIGLLLPAEGITGDRVLDGVVLQENTVDVARGLEE